MQSSFPGAPSNAPALRFGTLELATRFLLSPLAGYTNLPFRRIVRAVGGVGLATTDLVNAKGLLAGSHKSLRLIETCAADRPFAVQIFGSDPSAMCDAARMLQERGVDSVDINMGCPVERITKGGSGASMMCSADRTIDLVRQVVESVQIPITVKMRLGWDSTQLTAPKFARAFEQVGVAAVAIHGRTRAQGFGGTVDLDGIRQVVEAVDHIPVIGNGDVRNVDDADRMLRSTGCDGVSVGRGALANPWIFRQLHQWDTGGSYEPAGTFDDRLELLKRHFRYLVEQIGETSAVITFRKTGHWYLKAMRVRARLRNRFQMARTTTEIDETLLEVAASGPVHGNRNALPEMHIPVPSGPVEHW